LCHGLTKGKIEGGGRKPSYVKKNGARSEPSKFLALGGGWVRRISGALQKGGYEDGKGGV